ncbi:hybrid sensor histidine kinase/response regulator [Rhodospirillum rubrum]|uniref:ATP-binding protein n=1 Tax=Rhodospirillum rubrum TaxID=1085 RepID=UPI0019061EB7|nr:ATP-binding protein [Rhodospirillum rubrum]MBK1664787.1 hybrid sensor histidine kinase/response regulator [Rhodospirillum rubrum]MBK1676635.1 hybrid sensor histidine kinase/response regulator [Rhodospirillum rubrum]
MPRRIRDGLRQGLGSTLGRRVTRSLLIAIVVLEILVVAPSAILHRRSLLDNLKADARAIGLASAAPPEASLGEWGRRLGVLLGDERITGAQLLRNGFAVAGIGDRPDSRPGSQGRHADDGHSLDIAIPLTASETLTLRLDKHTITKRLWSEIGWLAVMTLGMAGAVILIATIMAGRIILLPLLDLRRLVVDMRPGEGKRPSAEALERPDELGELFRAVEDLRRRIEMSLLDAATQARFPSENPNPVIRTSGSGGLLYANASARLRPGFLEGETLHPTIIALVRETIGRGEIMTLEIRLGTRIYLLNAVPIIHDRYVNIYVSDVTDRVKAEIALRSLNESLEAQVLTRTRDLAESEARTRAIIATMVDGLIVMDDQGRIDLFNAAAQRIFGYDESEVVGQNAASLMSAEDAAGHAEPFGLHLWDGRSPLLNGTLKVIGRRKNGASFPLAVAISELPAPPPGGAPARRLFTGVIRDISDQIRHESDLRKAKEEAEVANRAKSDFLAVMSHELRTPLNGVLGMAELLCDTPLDPEQQRYARTIAISAEALLVIINDILDLSKIEAGHLDLENRPFDPASLLEGVRTLMEGPARDKAITLRTAIEGTNPTLRLGDEGRLRQILLNLANNGLKFTEKGSVTLRLKTGAGGSLRFEVEDTGIGIPQESHDKLFHDFTQVSASTARRFGGSGLGLSICRRLVGLMGGRLGFDSTPGVGSLFWFEVDLPEARAVQSQPVAPPPGEPLSILVVEDNEINRQVALGLLTKLGHRVTCVDDGAAAVRIVDTTPFDLILMDVQMPGMDGYEATRLIRGKPAPVGTLPIVAMTANATSGDVAAAMAAGMTGYLSKPITRKRLAEALIPHSPATEVSATG